jgi:signal transduction histidine kinase
MTADTVRLLLIDDDEEAYHITRDLAGEAASLRLHLDWVRTYDEGLEALRALRYDLYLIGYRLDGRDGLELIRTAVADGCTAPLIILTGLSDVDIEQAAMAAGAADYLVKGRLTAELLERAIRYSLDQKGKEADLLRSEARLKEAQRIARIGNWEWEFGTKTLYWSDQLFRIMGRDPAGPPPTLAETVEAVHPEDRNRFQDRVRTAREAGESFSLDYRIMRPDGGIRTLRGEGEPIRAPDGTPLRLMAVAQDITEQKRMEEELIRARKFEAAGMMAAGIGHDFNNMLTVILGNLELAQDEGTPSEQLDRYLAEAGNAALRARDLTSRLVSLSQGAQPLFRVAPVADPVRQAVDSALAGSGVDWELTVSERPHPVEIDPEQIRHAISNLAVNAREAMPEGGRVSVHLRNFTVENGTASLDLPLEKGDYVEIVIRDRGRGISTEDLPRIFDPYFSTKERGVQKGMGLGLSLAYAIIQKHRGALTVASAPGEGTAFFIYLPAAAAYAARAVDRRIVREGGTPRILMMDDEEMIHEVGGRMLERLGYEGVFARTGEAALDLYQSALATGRRFAAVILDLTVPRGMGGRETIRKLLEIDPSVRAIVSSGYFSDPVMTDYDAYGFIGALPKPYSKKELEGVLRETLSRH